MVEMDPIRNLPLHKIALAALGFKIKLWRGKARKDFACECGWRYKYGLFERMRPNELFHLFCPDCGNIYTLAGLHQVNMTRNPARAREMKCDTPDDTWENYYGRLAHSGRWVLPI